MESLEHLLWTCRKNQKREWEMWRLGIIQTPTERLLSAIDHALSEGQRNPSFLAALGFITETIWRQRNEKMFRNKHIWIPTRNILKALTLEVEASLNARDSDNRFGALRRALTAIGEWKITLRSIAAARNHLHFVGTQMEEDSSSQHSELPRFDRDDDEEDHTRALSHLSRISIQDSPAQVPPAGVWNPPGRVVTVGPT
ncbi:hypothetical protein R1sor_012175 [Riccia sorocarpa]|uniref:Uncharacterized protein n=1 Tax=Riccia sorocarpa TaxID=122646 RepID=A0ABD3I6D2_9MARC